MHGTPVTHRVTEVLGYAQRFSTNGSLSSSDVCINWVAAWHDLARLPKS